MSNSNFQDINHTIFLIKEYFNKGMLVYRDAPLTEDLLQKLYKSKTYLRNEEWDVIWYLGGKNNVTIGEKNGKFFLLPQHRKVVVTDILPFELIQGEQVYEHENPILLENVGDLNRVFSEFNFFDKRLF